EAVRFFMDCSIHSDVDITNKAHVRVEKKRLGASIEVRVGAGALNVSDAHEAIEVGDGCWIDALTKEGEVEIDSVDADSVRRRLRRSVGRLGRQHVGWTHTGAYRRAGNTRHRPDEGS